MKDKNLALNLIALAATMLFEDDFTVENVRETKPCGCGCRCNTPTFRPQPRKPEFDFTREPDGVQINVDRPREEKFASRKKWAEAMANYRMLIDQAKKCDWESRIPENIPPHVHAGRRDWYEDNEPIHPFEFATRRPTRNTGWGW